MFLLMGLQNKQDRKKLDYRLFMIILALVCVELFADSAMLLTDGSATKPGQWLLRNATFIFYTVNPFITMVYAVYVELLTRPAHRRKRKRLVLYFVPAVVIFCLSFVSLFTNWLFLFDSQGYVHKGRFSSITTVVFYGYLTWALAIANMRRRTVNPGEFKGLVTFPVPMAFCGVLQLLLPDYAILLPSFTLSLLVLSANIQQRRLMYDYLTGAYNRRRLDEYLDVMIQDCRNSGKMFCAFLADVNDFKHINDQFGHLAGDEALVTVVKVIRESLRFDDFLARYAGDEFVVVLPNCEKQELEIITERIHQNFQKSSNGNSRYALSISIGGSVFDPAFHGDAEDYVGYLDSLMYEQKKNYHKVESDGRKRGEPETGET
jgi:diguanylate cyclase (GGDEF)-like protein